MHYAICIKYINSSWGFFSSVYHGWFKSMTTKLTRRGGIFHISLLELFSHHPRNNSTLRLNTDTYLCSCRCLFDDHGSWRCRPCAMWKMAIGFYWQMKCVWSVLMHCHPPKSWALQQLSLAASHSEAFYSLWISVKSLSSHTALCSPPLFSTLGGHFSSNSVKERAQLNSTESVCFILFVLSYSKYLK